MSGTRTSRLALRLLAALAALAAAPARADQAAQVHAQGGWIRLLPAQLPAAGYVTLHNDGSSPTTLRGASSPRYARVMLHKSSSRGGTGRMQMVVRLVIPPHGDVHLAPGGYHLMLEHPSGAVAVGQHVVLNLAFADGSQLPVAFKVRPASALGP